MSVYIYIYKYIVYLFTCNKCLKHYSRKFVRGENCTQRHLHEHFQLPGHTGFLQDIYVTLIDKTNPRILTKHENYWIHTIGQSQLCDLMFKVVTELCFYMVFLQLFLFLDLDSLF